MYFILIKSQDIIILQQFILLNKNLNLDKISLSMINYVLHLESQN